MGTIKMNKTVENLKQLWKEEKLNTEITLEVLREGIIQFPNQAKVVNAQIKTGEARLALIIKKLRKLEDYE